MFEDDLQILIPPKPLASEFDQDSIAEIMHERTKYYRSTISSQSVDIARFLLHPVYISRGAAGFTSYQSHPVLNLPPAAPLVAELGEALAQRRSVRNLSGPITLEQVSSLLWHAAAVNHRDTSRAAPEVTLDFRPYPSPGNLNALEFYVFLNNVKDVDACIAHYDSRNHCLRILSEQDGTAFSQAEIITGDNGVDAPLIIAVAMVPQRLTAKYGPRGYRLALLEAGHATQNLALTAQGMSLGSLVYASFYDDELAALLGLDGVSTTIASTLLVGVPS